MPTPFIKKLAREGKASIAELEKKWEEAKKAAASSGHAKDYGYIMNIFKKMAGVTAGTEGIDTITVDVPLFLRLLELSREDLKDDVQIHEVTDRCLKLASEKEVLTIEDYPAIWPGSEEPLGAQVPLLEDYNG